MKQAFIAIDVQNAWADDNPFTTDAIEDAVVRLRPVMPIIWVYLSWLPIQKPFQAREFALTTDFNTAVAWDVHNRWNQPALKIEPEDWIVTKSAKSLFNNPDAESFLRGLGVNELFMAGFKATECVYASAYDARRVHRFKTTVLSGLTADYDDVTDCEGKEFFDHHGIQFRRLSACGLG
jgi:nicotinamidase-related amidase